MMRIAAFVLILSYVSIGTTPAQKVEDRPVPQVRIQFERIDPSRKSFELRITIKNLTGRTIALDKSGVTYGYVVSSEHGAFSTRGEPGPEPAQPRSTDYVVLKPSASLVAERVITLDDELIRDNGLYKIKIIYGQFLDVVFRGYKVWQGAVESNELKLNIFNKRVFLAPEQKRRGR